jgi:hypothetical protein
MAYMNQARKAELAPGIKAVLAKYGVKGSISVDNHSTLVVTIKEGAPDFIGEANRFNREYAERRGERFHPVEGYYQANPYRGADDYADTTVGQFFRDLTAAMRGNLWYDNSDIMTDYFDTAYYLQINVGKYDRPYVCTGPTLNGLVNGQPEEFYTFA